MNPGTSGTWYRRSPYAESVEMDGEWIIFHAKNQTMTKLNELGGLVWVLLQEGATEVELIRMVLGEYQVPFECVRSDIQAFLTSLIDAEVVELIG